MTVRSHVWVAILAGMLLLPTLCGCAAKKPSPEATKPSTEAPPSSSSLAQAAEQTYAKARGASPTEGGIPPECWAGPIKALHPIKVYTHRVNIVVVQRIHDGIEEGKYIYIPISSYLPHTGDDGFEFTPNSQRDNAYYVRDGVFDFKRTISKQ